jgi:hypothetical protein
LTVVDGVLDAHKGAMRIRNLDRLFRIGLATRTTNRVQKSHKLDGAINVGAIRGIIAILFLINCRHYSDDDFFRRKFDLLEDQIVVWAEEFRVPKFEVWLQNLDVPHMHGTGTSNTKIIVDPIKARQWVMTWRREWERTGKAPNIKIRPV